MTDSDRKLAKELAVRYEAFLSYLNQDDKRGMACWAPMLRDVQKQTGIMLVTDIDYWCERLKGE